MRILAPLPTATMAMTDATPMMMPSAVRPERNLFRLKARIAIHAVCDKRLSMTLTRRT
jgi:hypothetical protein